MSGRDTTLLDDAITSHRTTSRQQHQAIRCVQRHFLSSHDTQLLLEVLGLDEFRTSSFCMENGCVEVATTSDGVAVRDSENPDTVLRFSRAAWAAFVAGVQAGEFSCG